ncbi:MAG: carboxypeptidase-like regulatory domain-containing protein [Planctomycetota bacterium]
MSLRMSQPAARFVINIAQIFTSAIFVFCFCSFSDAQQAAVDASSPPAKTFCYGSLSDSDGKPIDNASLTLVQGIQLNYNNPFQLLTDKPKTLQTKATAGKFQFDLSDKRQFFAPSENNLLIATCEGFQTKVVPFKTSRLLVDLSFDLTMTRSRETTIYVVDEKENPVAGAELSICRLANHQIPLHFSSRNSVKTGIAGTARIPGCNASTLQQLYISSKSHGNQQVPLQLLDGKLVARLTPVSKLRGRVTVKEEPLDLDRPASIIIGTMQQVEYRNGSLPTTSWQHVTTENGNFEIENLAHGKVRILAMPSEFFPYVMTIQNRGKSLEHNADSISTAFDFDYIPARSVEFTFHDEQNRPIENLIIAFTAGPARTTDSEGKARFWFGKDATLDGQLFHFDAFERYSMDAFGINLVRLKEIPGGGVAPLKLPSTAEVRGSVKDESGKPVANAKVNASFGQERFTMLKTARSDKNGRFVLRGLPPAASVELTASRDNMMTDPNQKILAQLSTPKQTPAENAIVVREQLVARITGRLVDKSGAPVSGIRVLVNRALVNQKEAFNFEQLFPSPLAEAELGLMTDADGRFMTPPIIDFSARFQVEVRNSSIRPYRSLFRDAAKRGAKNGQVDLGEFRITRQPAVMSHALQIVGPDNSPVPNAEVACVGPICGRAFATSDSSGMASLELPNSPAVLLVRAKGMPVHLQLLPQQAEAVVKLGSQPATMVPMRDRVPELRSIANQLVNELDFPKHSESTFYRQSRYFQALATTDAKKFSEIMLNPAMKYQHKDALALGCVDTLFRDVPELCMQAITLLSNSPDTKTQLMSGFATSLQDADDQEEVLGEAILSLNELGGDQKLISAGYVAKSLACTGRFEEATLIVEESWAEAEELQKILNESRREHKRGLARIYVPCLAWVDPNKALRLIELTADQTEVPSLQAQALILLSMQDMPAAVAKSRRDNIDLNPGVANFLQSPFGKNLILQEHLTDWYRNLAAALNPSAPKLKLLLLALRNCEDTVQRRALVTEAVSAWENAKVDYWYHWTDPAKEALEVLPSIDNISAEEIGQLLFAAAKTGPTSFDTNNDVGVFANFARLLGMLNPEISQSLIEAALEETTWMHNNSRPWLDNNLLLGSMAWSNPQWAMSTVRELAKELGAEDDVHRLQLICSLVADIEKIIAATR